MPPEAYTLEFQPITLKQLAADADISQSDMVGAVGRVLGREVSRPTINLCFNRGYIPRTFQGFKEAVEQVIREHTRAMSWLLERGLKVSDIWLPLGRQMRNSLPAGHVRRVQEGMKRAARVETADPTAITVDWEVEMLHPEAMKKFRLFRNPFVNEINSEKDIYMSEEHSYLEAAMMDAAHHAGYLAVVGEVQSGKSCIRKKVVENLLKDGNVTVIFPRNHKINLGDGTKSRVNAVSLCDAIIMDISGETPKIKTEHKLRQLERLLIARAEQGQKHVLIIEEAHNLTIPALKYTKQFHELEQGFRKLLSVILIGQTELESMLDERLHPELREVIRRIQVAKVTGLNGNLRKYLEFKFKKVGAEMSNVLTDEAIDALKRRLTVRDERGRDVSKAYPGLVQLHVIRAINLAWELGQEKVTAEVMEAI